MLCEALERGVLGVGDGGSILRAVPAVPQEVIPHSHESVLDQPPGCGGTRAKPVGKSGSVLEGVIGHLTRPMGGGDVRKRSAQVDSSWDDCRHLSGSSHAVCAERAATEEPGPRGEAAPMAAEERASMRRGSTNKPQMCDVSSTPYKARRLLISLPQLRGVNRSHRIA
ncbi:hypothetical protein B0T12DRAFT_392728 [Alternaria alternata]|nr:hypothetical protein B0T12DRAFT_392728 [Alternaria alternata]